MAFLVLTSDAYVNPGQPEVRRNFNRVHDHVLDPGITNVTEQYRRNFPTELFAKPGKPSVRFIHHGS